MKFQTKVIIEVAQAHEGSLGLLHSYIDAISKTGADYVKFQTHIASAESSEFEPFRVNFSFEDKTRYDYWKRMEFTEEEWRAIKQHCEHVGLKFISSPFSIEAVELLERLGVESYKIASGEVGNFLMIEKIAKTTKPLLISSGMSSYTELDKTIDFVKPYGNQYALFQCTTAYPTPPEKVGLNVITEMKERYHCAIGLSDHSGTIYPSLAAVALGAELIEVHAVFSKEMFGPDTSSSLTIPEIKQLVAGIRTIEKSLQHPIDKTNNEEYIQLKTTFGKSLALRRNAKAGEVIAIEDLESKKPGNVGIPVSEYRNIIGRKIKKDLSKFAFLKYNDLEEE